MHDEHDVAKQLRTGGSYEAAFWFIPIQLPCEHEEGLSMLEWDAIDAGNVKGDTPRVWGFADAEAGVALIAAQLNRLSNEHLGAYLREFGQECVFDTDEEACETWMECLGEYTELAEYERFLESPISHLEDCYAGPSYQAFTKRAIVDALARQMLAWMEGERDESVLIQAREPWLKQVLNYAEEDPTTAFVIIAFRHVELGAFNWDAPGAYQPDILEDSPTEAYLRCVHA